MTQASNKSRRAFLGIIGTTIGASLLAACSSAPAASQPTPAASANKSAPAAAPATAQPAAKAAPAAAGAVSLSFWTFPVGSPDSQTWLKGVVDAYPKQHPNVKIDTLYMTWDMIEKVNTAIAAQSTPDLLGRTAFEFLAEAIKAGIAQEITLPKDLKDDLPDKYYDALLWQGKIYTIPWHIVVSAPRINLTLAKEAKAESLLPKKPAESWDWSQWREFAKAVTRKRPNGQQAWATAIFTQTKLPAYHWQTWQYFWNMGVDMYKDPQQGGCIGLNTDAGIKGLQFFHDLYYVDKVVPNPSSVRFEDVGTDWNQGSIAYQPGAGQMSAAVAKGETLDKSTMVVTDQHGFEWLIVQNPVATGVQEQCWGGAQAGGNLLPLKQKDSAKLSALTDFGFYLVNKPNQVGIAPFDLPVRASAVKSALSDNPLAEYTFQYLVPGSHVWRADGNSQKLLDIFNTHFVELFLGKSPAQVANEFAAEANAVTGCK